jgi:hypothetical protein
MGQIAGATRRYDGMITFSSHDEQGYFTPSNSHVLWKIRYGIFNKAVEAFERDLEIAENVEYEIPNILPTKILGGKNG